MCTGKKKKNKEQQEKICATRVHTIGDAAQLLQSPNEVMVSTTVFHILCKNIFQAWKKLPRQLFVWVVNARGVGRES